MSIDYVKEGRIAIFTINRPHVKNAMNIETTQELHEALINFREDPETWVGIITGAEDKVFCGGADLKEMRAYIKTHNGKRQPRPATPMRGLDIWKPLVAAINGSAFGGGMEIVLACDIRIASEKALFGLPEVTLGLMPGWGATQRLPRMIPWCKAAELLFTGKLINAQEAYRIGLVNQTVKPEDVMSTAKHWATIISQAAPLAVQTAKESMVRGISMTLEKGLALEDSLENRLVVTEDFIEGTTAFLEKRKPLYKGK